MSTYKVHMKKFQPQKTYIINSVNSNNNTNKDKTNQSTITDSDNKSSRYNLQSKTSRSRSRSFSNMDDFIDLFKSSNRLKEKNQNLINISNNNNNNNATNLNPASSNSHNNNDYNVPNLNYALNTKIYQINLKENSIAYDQNNHKNSSYIKTILSKHKSQTAKPKHTANASASSLALAALNVTTTTMTAANALSDKASKVLLLPDILINSNLATTTNFNQYNNNSNDLNRSTNSAKHHKKDETNKPALRKYSSTSLFKFNHLKSHFQSKQQ